MLEKRGVVIRRQADVTGFERQNGEIRTVRYTQNKQVQEEKPDLVVLAAGSWSPQLARLAGESLPLMPGKGYAVTLDNPVKKLNYPCILVEDKVALTPWPNRLRIGSTMEIGSINNRILFPRVQGISRSSAAILSLHTGRSRIPGTGRPKTTKS